MSWLLGTLQWPWFCWNVLSCSRRWSNVCRFCFCLGLCLCFCVGVAGIVVSVKVSSAAPARAGAGEGAGEGLGFIFLFLEPFGRPLPLLLLAAVGDCVSSVGFVVVVFLETGLFEFAAGEGSGIWTAVVLVVLIVLILILILVSAVALSAAAAVRESLLASFGLLTSRDVLTSTGEEPVPVDVFTILDMLVEAGIPVGKYVSYNAVIRSSE